MNNIIDTLGAIIVAAAAYVAFVWLTVRLEDAVAWAREVIRLAVIGEEYEAWQAARREQERDRDAKP